MIRQLTLCLIMAVHPTNGMKNRNHPTVQADANTIDIDVRGQTDYLGPLYVGQ